MKLYTYTTQDITAQANQVREVVAANLYTEGLIDVETARKLTEDYALLVVEKGLLGKAIDKILGIKDEPVFQMVKLVKLPQQEKEKQNDNHQSEGSA